MKQQSTALVLGASGGIGGELARQLRDAGWQVRALQRGLASASAWRDGIDWRRGDAMQLPDVLQAARGCAVIVHAVNPPGYRRWAELVLPMLDHTIAAACAEHATIVLPGTVYNYGTDVYPCPDEDAPQTPGTRKGALRAEMERRLQVATTGGARALILRSGDYFGPQARSSWFAQALVTPGRPVTTLTLPGAPGVGHQWAYLPDVAVCMRRLLEQRATLPAFARLHMAGHWDADGTQMAGAITRVVARHGGAEPRLRRVSRGGGKLVRRIVRLAGGRPETARCGRPPFGGRNPRSSRGPAPRRPTPRATGGGGALTGSRALPDPRLA
ncbi:NAD-dependent epimerase/dehydratase family protein, partial [Xanthomonas maliensis]|uniref:NAD-dependent epimerase/dehydratase family protein n=1 Tax=Xanthomonas maliensis TaxID=1321368 RepID=UPI001FD093A6